MVRLTSVAPWALLLLLFPSPGCAGSSGLELVVDVRTDFVPGVDFASVQTHLIHGPPNMAMGRYVSKSADAFLGVDFFTGRHIATFGGLAAGDYTLRVSLLDGSSGSTVAERTVAVALTANRAVTVLITRSCRDVTCPDDQTCLGGRCIDPHCSLLDTSSCPAAACTSDGDCPSGASCAVPRCVERVCTLEPDDATCGAGRYCDPSAGCATPGGTDAGMPDAGPRCDDGLKNGDETDVDCGGSCSPCGTGAACGADGDCASTACRGGVCCMRVRYQRSTQLASGCQSACCDPGDTLVRMCDCADGMSHFVAAGMACALPPGTPPAYEDHACVAAWQDVSSADQCARGYEGAMNGGDACVRIECETIQCP